MSDAKSIREQAQATGGRTLEMIAGTPRLNAWYYAKFADRIRGDVLELGSGIGNLSQLLANDAQSLVVTDVEDAYLQRLQEMFSDSQHVVVSGYDLDEPPPPAVSERSFDVIISSNVLEHVADDRRAISDLVARLKPDGHLLTYVPAVSAAFGTLDTALGHHRRYGRRQLGERMRSAGLVVERLEYMNALGLVGWFVNGRVLRKTTLDPRQVRTFERLVPLVRLEDRLRLPIGLGLVCHARKPG